LEVVKNIGKLFCDADAHLRVGFSTKESRRKVQLDVEIDSHIVVSLLDVASETIFGEKEKVDVFFSDSNDLTEIHIAQRVLEVFGY
jgi:hypothetical protein